VLLRRNVRGLFLHDFVSHAATMMSRKEGCCAMRRRSEMASLDFLISRCPMSRYLEG
jgi:hypothetical protein